MSRDFVLYGAVTHDEYLRRWREQHDLCVAFFDEDRAERPLDHTPCVDQPPRSTPVPRPADASGGANSVRQPTGTDLPEAA